MTFHEKIRSVLSTVLSNVDSAMKVYDYYPYPKLQTPVELLKLFAVDGIVNTAFFSQRQPATLGDPYATGHNTEIRFGESLWAMRVYGSIQDPVNDASLTAPSEYAFQSKCLNIQRGIFTDPVIRDLMKQNITVQSVSIDDISFEYWDFGVHSAIFTIIIRHPVSLTTIL